MLKSSVRPETSMSAEAPRTRRPQILTTRRLALAGIVGPPIFVAVFLVLGVIKPHYNAVDQLVSAGSIGELGWIQICNFLAVGAALAIFSLGLWRGFGDRVSGRIGSALVGVAGVALIGAGVFVGDPTINHNGFGFTTHGALHIAMSLVTFISLPVACFFFARRFWNELPFAIYLIVSGILIGVGASQTTGQPGSGITQRVTLVIMLTWITILGPRLRKSSPGTTV